MLSECKINFPGGDGLTKNKANSAQLSLAGVWAWAELGNRRNKYSTGWPGGRPDGGHVYKPVLSGPNLQLY